MDTINPFKDQSHSIPLRKLLLWSLYVLLPIITIFHLISHPYPLSLSQSKHSLVITPSSSTPSKGTMIKKEIGNNSEEISCDYSNGTWIHDKLGPLYTKCDTIKEGQNCISHGRQDNDYLYWKWKPKNCQLPRFDPKTFLEIFKNKNLGFIGDSLARNQLESLLCLLSTFSPHELVYSHGDDNKFRKWNFPIYNVNISIYWSPFLVKGIEKSEKKNYNTLFLESIDEKWANDLVKMDLVVFVVGHWFLHSGVYYYDDKVLGCHSCSSLNYTEIGFYDVYGKAFETTFKTIIEKKNVGEIDVIVTTFSPAHFEGEWDKYGACPKTKPYDEKEKEKFEWMDAAMRETTIKQVNDAKRMVIEKNMSNSVRFEVLDVTKLAYLRPDGHPGPYMHPFPFANGIMERVQNDCVHWCLPGPIDTWNEILLQVIKKTRAQ